MMRKGRERLWILASVLAVVVTGCCDSDHVLGVRESGGGGPATVPLGTTATFVVLRLHGDEYGATAVTGDLGVSPGTAVTGFPPGTVSGTIHAGDTPPPRRNPT